MNPKQIVIDGKTYNSVEEMPADVRRNYEEALRNMGSASAAGAPNMLAGLAQVFADNNNDGTPDMMQSAPTIKLSGGMKIVVNGQTYDSVDDLPPEFRARYEQAMGAMDKNRNGIPDFVEGMMNVSASTPQAPQMVNTYSPESPRRASPISTTPTNSPEQSSGWILAIGIGLLLFLCAFIAFGAWYFFLR